MAFDIGAIREAATALNGFDNGKLSRRLTAAADELHPEVLEAKTVQRRWVTSVGGSPVNHSRDWIEESYKILRGFRWMIVRTYECYSCSTWVKTYADASLVMDQPWAPREVARSVFSRPEDVVYFDQSTLEVAARVGQVLCRLRNNPKWLRR